MATISDLIDIGQQVWLEGLGREEITKRLLLGDGKRKSVTGLVISIDACAEELQAGTLYDRMIRSKLQEGSYGERLALDVLIDEARYAADLLQPVFQKTNGRDGWVVLPVSSLLMGNSMMLVESLAMFHAEVHRANTMISIPGLPHLLPVIKELIRSGIPVHIGLIFSPFQLRLATQTFLEAIEARIAIGHEPLTLCFVSVPVDCLLAGLQKLLPEEAAVKFGIGVIVEIAETVSNQFRSKRWERAISAGSPSFRLLWLFGQDRRESLSNFLITQMSEGFCTFSMLKGETISPLSFHDFVERSQMIGGNEQRLASSHPAYEDIDFAAFAERLQKGEADSLVQSWIVLLDNIARKSAKLAAV